jgi:hypothetical protein
LKTLAVLPAAFIPLIGKSEKSVIIWIRCQDSVSDHRDIAASRGDVAQTEQAVRFRFPVTWSTLLDPSAFAPLGEKTRVVQKAASDSSIEWAMVIPKLAPPAAPTRLLPAAASTLTAQFAAPRYVVPKFEVSSAPASLTVKVLLSASVALLLIPGWRNTDSPGARAVQVESRMSERGWVHWTPELVLYSPSLSRADYRMEFTWPVNPEGVAWAFRAKDSDNYYAVRIKPFGPEPSRMLSVEHFTRYRGVEKSRVVKLLTWSKDDPSVHVKMDVAGSTFKLHLGGNVVSQWTDSRLLTGGLGFIEDGNHRAEVQSVQISFPRQ